MGVSLMGSVTGSGVGSGGGIRAGAGPSGPGLGTGPGKQAVPISAIVATARQTLGGMGAK